MTGTASQLTFAASLLLAAITTAQAQDHARPLSLVQALSGHSNAHGAFTSEIAGVKRSFWAALDGALHGDVFVLAESFRFTDGERQKKTWRFTKTGPGQWSGTREDVIGTADVIEDGPVIRLNYIATLPTAAGPVPVHFADTIYRTRRGVLFNTATVSELGIPVGSVSLTIQR